MRVHAPRRRRMLTAAFALQGALPGAALVGCSSSGEGPTNLLAARGPCDGLSIYTDPACVCCANFAALTADAPSDSASAVAMPTCVPGAGIYDTGGSTTSACAPQNAADACGPRCPEGYGCLDGLCEECAEPGQTCRERACCCPGESEARSCRGTCDCETEPDGGGGGSEPDWGAGGFSGQDPDPGAGGGSGGDFVVGGYSGEGPVTVEGRVCPPAPLCPIGQPYCECILGDPPLCERGTCLQFGDGRTMCVLSCEGVSDNDGCAEAAAAVACGNATCNLDLGPSGARGCALFCTDSRACPAGQSCRTVAGSDHQKLCLP